MKHSVPSIPVWALRRKAAGINKKLLIQRMQLYVQYKPKHEPKKNSGKRMPELTRSVV
jgi:hypothetical protein